MPQPYKGKWELSSNSLTLRPKMAAHIGYVAAMWSQVEASLGQLFGVMLQTEATLGTAMYLSLISEQARDSAMRAAAAHKLSDAQAKTFEALLKDLKRPRKMRNTVVHGLWAISDSKPDSLILVQSDKLIKMVAASHVRDRSAVASQKHGDALQEMKESHLEYTEKDFLDIQNSIIKAGTQVAAFHFELVKPHLVRPTKTPSRKSAPQ